MRKKPILTTFMALKDACRSAIFTAIWTLIIYFFCYLITSISKIDYPFIYYAVGISFIPFIGLYLMASAVCLAIFLIPALLASFWVGEPVGYLVPFVLTSAPLFFYSYDSLKDRYKMRVLGAYAGRPSSSLKKSELLDLTINMYREILKWPYSLFRLCVAGATMAFLLFETPLGDNLYTLLSAHTPEYESASLPN